MDTEKKGGWTKTLQDSTKKRVKVVLQHCAITEIWQFQTGGWFSDLRLAEPGFGTGKFYNYNFSKSVNCNK